MIQDLLGIWVAPSLLRHPWTISWMVSQLFDRNPEFLIRKRYFWFVKLTIWVGNLTWYDEIERLNTKNSAKLFEMSDNTEFQCRNPENLGKKFRLFAQILSRFLYRAGDFLLRLCFSARDSWFEVEIMRLILKRRHSLFRSVLIRMPKRKVELTRSL